MYVRIFSRSPITLRPVPFLQAEAKPDGNAVACYIARGTTYLYAFYIFGFDGPSA